MAVTIKTKLWVGFSLLVVVVVGVCVTGRIVASRAAGTTARMVEGEVAEVVAAKSASSAMSHTQSLATAFFRKPDRDTATQVPKALASVSEQLSKLSHLARNDDRRRAVTEATANASAYARTFDDVIAEYGKRGYNENEGAQGTLRTAVHAVETGVAEQNLPELSVLMLQCRRHEKDYMLRHEEKYIAQIGDRVKEFKAKLADLHMDADKQKPLIALWDTYLAGVNTFVAADKSAESKRVELETVAAKLRESVEQLADRSATAVDDAKASVLGDLSGQATLMTIVLAVSVVLGCGVAFLTARAVIVPVNHLQHQLHFIATNLDSGDGDLTRRVDVLRKDEIGAVAVNVNSLITALHVAIRAVAEACGSVASATCEIAASSEEVAKNIDRQAHDTAAVSAATAEMSASAEEVAKRAEQVSVEASEAGKAATTGEEVVRRTLDDLNLINTTVAASAASVIELGKRSDQIGAILEVINDVAEQTNLLALNAAIEAARAGEHGRGFAVVAEEVRKLAERTTASTREVTESIDGIRRDTSSAVEQIKAGAQQVRDGASRASRAGDDIRRIVDASRKVSELVTGIAAASHEQRDASASISKSLTSVEQLANGASNSAKQCAIASGEVSAKSEQLAQLVARYKLDAKDGAPSHATHAKKQYQHN